MEIQMPEVGKSFYTLCKKCGTERYHKVLALPTPESAKLECEVCHKKSTWKKPKPKVERVSKAKAAESASAQAHLEQFQSLMALNESRSPLKYSMKTKFALNAKLEHPSFGVGVVCRVMPDKVEVCFEDQVRLLVHNRS
ncbi:MAG: hypothetical protein N2578_07340 [Bdellovibrionaceae bacterium]|nr:hypothetical protein [Pseudobdellovibrionaceae bacterium]